MDHEDCAQRRHEDDLEEARRVDEIDRLVRREDRADGCLVLVVRDVDGEVRSPPLCIGEVSETADPARLVGFLGHLARTLRASGGTVVFVRGRPGPPFLTDADRRWHEAARAGLAGDGPELLRGAYLATPDVVRPFPAGPTLAGLAS